MMGVCVDDFLTQSWVHVAAPPPQSGVQRPLAAPLGLPLGRRICPPPSATTDEFPTPALLPLSECPIQGSP